MLWSESLIPTLKEAPAEAEAVSHKLMLRAGLIRKLSSGVYSYLPLGLRVLAKVEKIIRAEMNAAGAQELLLPALQPAKLWRDSGRFKEIGKVMISFRDRHDKEMVLGPTHEEVITEIARAYFKSYRQLPQILYQIQTKFRDEPRPRFGVLRSCEFIMKDAYSFDVDTEGLNKNYQKMYDAYHRILDACGLEFSAVKADPGIMGGDISHEFTVPVAGGEDIEIGHTFKLGTKYSEGLGARFLDKDGKEKPVIMGCYGLGVNRIVAAAIEQSHDKDGIIWPEGITPYDVLISVLNIQDKKSKQAAFKVYQDLKKHKIDVLLDERDERAGVKLKDADLIGVPLQLIIGEKNIQKGRLEIKLRKTAKITTIKLKDVLARLSESLS